MEFYLSLTSVRLVTKNLRIRPFAQHQNTWLNICPAPQPISLVGSRHAIRPVLAGTVPVYHTSRFSRDSPGVPHVPF